MKIGALSQRRTLVRLAGAGSLKALGALSAFAMLAVVSVALDNAEYGRFASAFAVANILSVVALGGCHVAVLRFLPVVNREGRMALDKWTRNRVTTNLIVIILLGAPITIALHQPVSLAAATYLLTVSITAADYAAARLRARGEVAISIGPKDVVWRVSSALLALVFLDDSSAERAIGLLAGLLLAFVVLQAVWARKLDFSNANPETASSANVRFGVASNAFWAASLVFALGRFADTAVLSIVATPAETGEYFAASRIAQLSGLALIAFNSIAAPELSKLFHGSQIQELREYLRSSLWVLVAVSAGAALFVFAFGGWLLGLFGDGYGDSLTVLRILTASSFVNAAFGPTGQLMQMADLERTFLRTGGLAQLVGFAALPVAYSAAGLAGAATATAGTTIVWNLVARRIVVEKLDLDPTALSLLRQSSVR